MTTTDRPRRWGRWPSTGCERVVLDQRAGARAWDRGVGREFGLTTDRRPMPGGVVRGKLHHLPDGVHEVGMHQVHDALPLVLHRPDTGQAVQPGGRQQPDAGQVRSMITTR